MSTTVVDSAILIADWGDEGGEEADLGVPNALLPLLDKPMLQWAVERLVRQGCRRVTLVLGPHPQPYRELLGSGQRWGCDIRYRYRRQDADLSASLRDVGVIPGCRYWIADAHRLPQGPVLPAAIVDDGVPALAICGESEGVPHWSGWGLFDGHWLLAHADSGRRALERRIDADPAVRKTPCDAVLSASTLNDYLAANRHLLAQGGDAGSATRIGRGCRIAPGARLLPPYHIGDHVHIAANAQIGPNAVIGRGVMIEGDTRVSDSVVLSNGYVGEGLDLLGAVVAGARLAKVATDTVVEVQDPHLLGSLEQSAAEGGPGGRWSAPLLRGVLAPLYSLCRLYHGPIRRGTGEIPLPRRSGEPTAVRVAIDIAASVPTAETARPWLNHFCSVFFPGLREVGRGHMALVGPTPRPPQLVRRLPAEWRRLYARSRCGLLNEALLLGPGAADPDEQFSSDALACMQAQQGAIGRRLLRRYLARVLADLRPRPRRTEDCGSARSESGRNHADGAFNARHNTI